MIEAMQTVREHDPQALYLIVGKTHPELERHVDFVDEYLMQSPNVDYLLASDVYVTPCLDLKQITSGTLAYALGAGKAIVSTPYPHAVVVLAGERSILVPFRRQAELAEATLRILGDPELEHRLERVAYSHGRGTACPRVGERMLAILRSATLNHDVDGSNLRPLEGAVNA
jgi:polysaccharide biosynthesis protein PslF